MIISTNGSTSAIVDVYYDIEHDDVGRPYFAFMPNSDRAHDSFEHEAGFDAELGVLEGDVARGSRIIGLLMVLDDWFVVSLSHGTLESITTKR